MSQYTNSDSGGPMGFLERLFIIAVIMFLIHCPVLLLAVIDPNNKHVYYRFFWNSCRTTISLCTCTLLGLLFTGIFYPSVYWHQMNFDFVFGGSWFSSELWHVLLTPWVLYYDMIHFILYLMFNMSSIPLVIFWIVNALWLKIIWAGDGD